MGCSEIRATRPLAHSVETRRHLSARPAFLRVFAGTLFLALLATFRAALDFLLLAFLLAAFLAAFFELLAVVVLALAFVALAAVALRAFFVARFRRAGPAVAGGTISGSETRPSAASGT